MAADQVATAAEASTVTTPTDANLPAWKRPFQVLEYPDFRHLWISTLPGTTAMQMGITARGYLAYDISGSAVQVGIVSLAVALPMLGFGLFGGVAADRFQKRNILLFTQSLQCSAAAINAILVLSGVIAIWQLSLVGIMTGIGMAYNMPARQAYVAQLVPRERVVNAVALQMSGMNFARIVGPAIAGVLIAIPFIDVGGTFVIVSLLFFSVFLNLLRIRNPGEPEAQERISALRSIADGLSYVRHNSTVLTLVLLAFIPMFLGNPYQQLMPVVAKDVFGVESAGLGILLAASGVGALLGSLVVASMSGIKRRGFMQMVLGMTFGGSLAVFVNSPTFAIALVSIIVVGAASASYQALNTTLGMHTADVAYRGRAMSLFHLTNGAAPLAILPVGYLTDAFGAPAVITVGGLILMVLIFCVGTFLPAYKRIG